MTGAINLVQSTFQHAPFGTRNPDAAAQPGRALQRLRRQTHGDGGTRFWVIPTPSPGVSRRRVGLRAPWSGQNRDPCASPSAPDAPSYKYKWSSHWPHSTTAIILPAHNRSHLAIHASTNPPSPHSCTKPRLRRLSSRLDHRPWRTTSACSSPPCSGSPQLKSTDPSLRAVAPGGQKKHRRLLDALDSRSRTAEWPPGKAMVAPPSGDPGTHTAAAIVTTKATVAPPSGGPGTLAAAPGPTAQKGTVARRSGGHENRLRKLRSALPSHLPRLCKLVYSNTRDQWQPVGEAEAAEFWERPFPRRRHALRQLD